MVLVIFVDMEFIFSVYLSIRVIYDILQTEINEIGETK